MAPTNPRTHSSCDACALRRVKCDGEDPCADCKKRNLSCTRNRPHRKRGPKGPRQATTDRIGSYTEGLRGQPSTPSDTSPESTGSLAGQGQSSEPEAWSYDQNLENYHLHLNVFQRDLATVWPIIDIPKLEQRLSNRSNHDWRAQALTASVCAATIAQLRLDQRPEPGLDSQPAKFAEEALQVRNKHRYQEYCDLDSLLTSFFLHVYYSNYEKLSTAAYLLREAVTTLQWLRLHDMSSSLYRDPKTLDNVPDYQRRLRIFWILFVSERTFCVQNDLTPTLDPINELPSSDLENPQIASSMAGLCALSRLFTVLKSSFFPLTGPKYGSEKEEAELIATHNYLRQEAVFEGISPTQKVDLNITRNWLRAIMWRYRRYLSTNFRSPPQPAELESSAEYLLDVARDALSLLSNSPHEAIFAHGYGMELKLWRLANEILDVLSFIPNLRDSAAVDDYCDILSQMKGCLQFVGGEKSRFAAAITERMQELSLPVSTSRDVISPGKVSMFGAIVTSPVSSSRMSPKQEDVVVTKGMVPA